MTRLDRRELIIAGSLAAICALSSKALAGCGAFASPVLSGRFFYDATIDPSGATAHAMAHAGWLVDRVDGRTDAVFSYLHRAGDTPLVLAGLTRPAARFVAEQVACRRGMRPIALVGPIWAFGLDSAAGLP